MHLMCVDFKFRALNSTVEHDEKTTFEDPSADGGSNRLAPLEMGLLKWGVCPIRGKVMVANTMASANSSVDKETAYCRSKLLVKD